MENINIADCTICPRMCHAGRTESGGNGFCQMGSLPVIARASLHFGEETCISGTNGSGTIFFSGCTMKCIFCQNYTISTNNYGKQVSVDRLCEIFEELIRQKAHNINFVNPTHFSHIILQALGRKKLPIPVVYNSSGYERVETLKMLEGLVDIYLPDFKYVSSTLSQRLSSAPNYFEYTTKAIAEMLRQTGVPTYDENGIITKGTIIRHLILPSNTKNSLAVLDYLAEHFPQIPVSLMAQYVPFGEAENDPQLGRTITKREYHKVLDYFISLDLDGYAQEISSATKKYTPDFNLQGV